jgi:hypothetical protein
MNTQAKLIEKLQVWGDNPIERAKNFVEAHQNSTLPFQVAGKIVADLLALLDGEPVAELLVRLHGLVDEKAQQVLNVLSWHIGTDDPDILVRGLRALLDQLDPPQPSREREALERFEPWMVEWLRGKVSVNGLGDRGHVSRGTERWQVDRIVAAAIEQAILSESEVGDE